MSRLVASIAVGFVLALIAIDAGWTPGYVRKIRQRIATGDADARTSMYRVTIIYGWVTCAIAIGLLLPTALPAVLGMPDIDLEAHGGAIIGAAIGLAISTAFAIRASRKQPRQPQRVVGDIDVLIPRTKRERGWFAATAVTASLTEEIVYRVVPILALTTLLPEVSPWWFVAATSVLFGVSHAYQGLAGMIATSFLGAVFGAILVSTGSVLPAMVLHVLVDLRVLLIEPPA